MAQHGEQRHDQSGDSAEPTQAGTPEQVPGETAHGFDSAGFVQRFWDGYVAQPGVIPLTITRGLAGKITRMLDNPVSLLADLETRWSLAETSPRQPWPELPLARWSGWSAPPAAPSWPASTSLPERAEPDGRGTPAALPTARATWSGVSDVAQPGASLAAASPGSSIAVQRQAAADAILAPSADVMLMRATPEHEHAPGSFSQPEVYGSPSASAVSPLYAGEQHPARPHLETVSVQRQSWVDAPRPLDTGPFVSPAERAAETSPPLETPPLETIAQRPRAVAAEATAQPLDAAPLGTVAQRPRTVAAEATAQPLEAPPLGTVAQRRRADASEAAGQREQAGSSGDARPPSVATPTAADEVASLRARRPFRVGPPLVAPVESAMPGGAVALKEATRAVMLQSSTGIDQEGRGLLPLAGTTGDSAGRIAEADAQPVMAVTDSSRRDAVPEPILQGKASLMVGSEKASLTLVARKTDAEPKTETPGIVQHPTVKPAQVRPGGTMMEPLVQRQRLQMQPALPIAADVDGSNVPVVRLAPAAMPAVDLESVAVRPWPAAADQPDTYRRQPPAGWAVDGWSGREAVIPTQTQAAPQGMRPSFGSEAGTNPPAMIQRYESSYVQRQPAVGTEPARPPTAATTPAAASDSAAPISAVNPASPLDVDELVEKVLRRFTHGLVVERERRGRQR